MFKGCTFDNQNVSSKADGGLYQSIFPKDGKLWGCSMSVTATALTVQPGELMIGGRLIQVDGATQVPFTDPITTGYGQIVLTIDLSQTSTETSFEQVEASVVYSTTEVFPDLTQGQINSQNGDMVYQAQLAVVSIAGGNVTGIVSQIGTAELTAQALGSQPASWYQDKITALENGLEDTDEKVATLSNPNLLINGGFAVWQRGESFTFARTGYGGGGYAADRWRVWANADSTGGNIVVTKAADGMHVESDGVCHTTYRFEPEDGLAGKTVCASMSVDGEIQTWVVTVPDGSTSATSNTITLPLPQSGTVNWIKAELGEEATPFVPRSYGEELLACMRYYQKTGTVFCPGYITVGGASFTYMPPVPMRIVPTIGGNVNDITVRPVDGDVIYQQTVGISSSQSSGDALYLTTTAPGVTANRPCVVQFSGLTLSAELMAEGGTVG